MLNCYICRSEFLPQLRPEPYHRRNVDVGDVVLAGLKSDAVKSVKLKEYVSFEVFPEIVAGKETR